MAPHCPEQSYQTFRRNFKPFKKTDLNGCVLIQTWMNGRCNIHGEKVITLQDI
jgi:hypothetical protein